MSNAMTVADLIAFLQTKPQHLLVVYKMFSERCLLEEDDIEIESLCAPRNDGWVANARPDREVQEYLVFPGN